MTIQIVLAAVCVLFITWNTTSNVNHAMGALRALADMIGDIKEKQEEIEAKLDEFILLHSG